MIYEIHLDKVPAQSLGVNIAKTTYVLQLRDVNGIMLSDIHMNGKKLITGVKCMPNQKIIPYDHLDHEGNFYFYCYDEHYPDYRKFGAEHKLYFLTPDEIELLPEMKDVVIYE